jgi:transposase-like protein
MPEVSCPKCHGNRLIKYGLTPAGKQKYKCRVPGCRHQHVAGSDHRVESTTKDIVKGLLSEKVIPAKIARAVSGISKSSIYKLAKETQ